MPFLPYSKKTIFYAVNWKHASTWRKKKQISAKLAKAKKWLRQWKTNWNKPGLVCSRMKNAWLCCSRNGKAYCSSTAYYKMTGMRQRLVYKPYFNKTDQFYKPSLKNRSRLIHLHNNPNYYIQQSRKRIKAWTNSTKMCSAFKKKTINYSENCNRFDSSISNLMHRVLKINYNLSNNP